MDISDIIFSEFGTPAKFNGITLASGAIIRQGSDMGTQHAVTSLANVPPTQRAAVGNFAKVTIRKIDLPAGVVPKYRDVVSDADTDWHIQPNPFKNGDTWECIGIGQFRAGVKA